MGKSLYKYSAQSASRLEKWLLRFKAFPGAFKEANLLGKIALILELFLPGVGTAIMGAYEKGIVSLVASGLVVFLAVYVGIQQGSGAVSLDWLTIVIFYLALVIGFYFLYISNYDATLKEVRRYSREKKYRFYSLCYGGILALKNKIQRYWVEFNDAYFKTNKKGRTMLILGFFVMGVPQMFYQQFIKGIVYLAVEAGLIVYLSVSGIVDFIGLCQLGVNNNGVFVYGILAALGIIALVGFYFSHLGSVLHWVKEDIKARRETFLDECDSLINEKFYVVGLIIPILGALIFTVVPITYMILTAFTNYSLRKVDGYFNSVETHEIVWNGFTTFGRLFQRPDTLMDMLSVFGWTMLWAFFATFTCYFGGMFLAMLLNKKAIMGKVVYRSLFVIAMALPQFVSLLVVRTMFDDGGMVNTILYQLGIITDMRDSIDFWDDAFWGKFLIIMVNMWVGVPYYMLLMSGLLLNIPQDLYEAADIEGASRWVKFRSITFPQVFYMTTPVLITSFVSNINNFNVIWFLTGGGSPIAISGTAGSTDILITWLYKLTFQSGGQSDYNLAAAIGIIMFILSASISLIVFTRSKAYNAEEEYR